VGSIHFHFPFHKFIIYQEVQDGFYSLERVVGGTTYVVVSGDLGQGFIGTKLV